MNINDLKIEDFLTYYPNIDTEISSISSLKEFDVLKNTEFVENEKLLPDQLFFQRFFSQYTPYRECLVFKGPGTGKTCTAIAVAENFKISIAGGPDMKILILMPGDDLRRSFKNEIMNICATNNVAEEVLGEEVFTRKNVYIDHKKLSKYYELSTHGTFFSDFDNAASANKLIKKYSNYTIIVDESHNFSEGLDIYKHLRKFLDGVVNCRKILLSGTPMRNSVNDIASQMNLILPMDKKFDTLTFETDYFDNNGDFRQDMKQDFIHKITGRVSFLREPFAGVKTVLGEKMPPWVKHNNVFITEMGKEQSDFVKSLPSINFLQNVRRASVVMPFGKRNDFLNNMKKYSCKFDKIKDLIIDAKNKGECVYLYSDYIKESAEGGGDPIPGAIEVLKFILNNLGFSEAAEANDLKKKGNRFISITSDGFAQRQGLQNLIKEFNKPDNKYGEKCRIIIGGPKIQEGFSFFNIRQIHIINPPWHSAALSQAVARGIRYGSLKAFENEKDRYINVYYHISVYNGFTDAMKKAGNNINNNKFIELWESPDLKVFKDLEEKEYKISQVVRLIKENAIDCEVNYSKNRLALDEDFSKECDFRECDYKCASTITQNKKEISNENYNIVYSKYKIHELKNKILKIFRQHTLLHFDELKDILQEQQEELIIIFALSEIIEKKIKIYNKYGFVKFLKEKGNVYYLSSGGGGGGENEEGHLDYIYSDYPIAKESCVFFDVLNDFENFQDKKYIEQFCESPQELLKDNKLDNLSFENKIMVLEEILLKYINSELGQIVIPSYKILQTRIQELINQNNEFKENFSIEIAKGDKKSSFYNNGESVCIVYHNMYDKSYLEFASDSRKDQSKDTLSPNGHIRFIKIKLRDNDLEWKSANKKDGKILVDSIKKKKNEEEKDDECKSFKNDRGEIYICTQGSNKGRKGITLTRSQIDKYMKEVIIPKILQNSSSEIKGEGGEKLMKNRIMFYGYSAQDMSEFPSDAISEFIKINNLNTIADFVNYIFEFEN